MNKPAPMPLEEFEALPAGAYFDYTGDPWLLTPEGTWLDKRGRAWDDVSHPSATWEQARRLLLGIGLTRAHVAPEGRPQYPTSDERFAEQMAKHKAAFEAYEAIELDPHGGQK